MRTIYFTKTAGNRGKQKDIKMQMVSLHLPPQILADIKALQQAGYTPNTSEFIRTAVVEQLLLCKKYLLEEKRG